MAANFTLKSQSYEGRYLQLTCTQTKNIANNTSTINWTLSALGGNVNYYTTGPTTVKINGQTVYSKERTQWSSYKFPAGKGSTSGSLTVAHNELGEATIAVSLSTAIFEANVQTKSGNWTLDNNPRGATLVSVPTGFTDEENPTITYSNITGNLVNSLQVCIASDDAKTIYVPYRDIDKLGSSYTFILSDAERINLWGAVSSGYSVPLRFYIKTEIGGSIFFDNKPVVLTLVNATPTLAPILTPHADTQNLTNDAYTIVRGFAWVRTSSGAQAYKGATIVSDTIKCGSQITTSGSYIYAPEVGTFEFTAIDSRGNVATQVVNAPFVNYINLTCDIEVEAPTTDGVATLKVSGNYFNNKFGENGIQNDIIVQYHYQENNGEFTTVVDIPVEVKSNNTYSGQATITGLNYRSTYTFQAIAIDKLNYVESAFVKVKTVPVFDWSENDFNFNVPVSFNGVSMADMVVANNYTDDWIYTIYQSGKVEMVGRWAVNAPITEQMGQLWRTNPLIKSLPLTLKNCYYWVDCIDGNCWASASSYGLPATEINYIIWSPWAYTGELIVNVRLVGWL